MRKAKVLLTSVAALAVSAGVALPAAQADSGEPSPNGRIQLQFYSFWGSQQRRPVIQAIVDEFNKSQNKYWVNYVYLPWGEVWTKELAGVAAGNPPDVVIQDINSVAIRAQAKQAMDLTPFLKKDNIQKQFYPNLWQAMLYKGHVYGIPFNTDTRVLFYNKTLFKQAGITHPPQTWAELDADAKKLDVRSGGSFSRIGFYPLWGNMGPDVWMLNADNGLSYLDYNKKKAAINTPNKQKALSWILQYNRHYGLSTLQAFSSQFGSGLQDPFVSGKVAMEVNIPGEYTVIRDYASQDFDFGIAPLPSYKKGSGHWSWGGGFDAEIPYGAKHPEGSWAFIKFLTGKWAQQYWGEHCFDTVANKSAMQAIAHDSNMTPTARMVYQATINNMKWTKLTPMPVWANGFTNLVTPLVNGALNYQIAPNAALYKAQQQVQQLIKKSLQSGNS
ncbi:MAG: ABC transporter substrate-binding protein [Alicyclobacillus sp.]|nr:ABC transporter substrate-binding protein [Alicyclobacillus sp.]